MANNEESMRFIEVDMAGNPPPAFSEVLDYWHAKRADRLAPAWSDINLMDLPAALLPKCIVVDFEGAQGPIRYRFFGTAIASLHGYELTNRTIQDMQPPDFRDQVIKQYRLLQEKRKPMFFIAHFPFLTGRRTRQSLLRLPLSSDGDTVTGAFSVQDLSDEDQLLSDFYARISERAE